jgi:hypothetical protein
MKNIPKIELYKACINSVFNRLIFEIRLFSDDFLNNSSSGKHLGGDFLKNILKLLFLLYHHHHHQNHFSQLRIVFILKLVQSN